MCLRDRRNSYICRERGNGCWLRFPCSNLPSELCQLLLLLRQVFLHFRVAIRELRFQTCDRRLYIFNIRALVRRRCAQIATSDSTRDIQFFVSPSPNAARPNTPTRDSTASSASLTLMFVSSVGLNTSPINSCSLKTFTLPPSCCGFFAAPSIASGRGPSCQSNDRRLLQHPAHLCTDHRLPFGRVPVLSGRPIVGRPPGRPRAEPVR
jgi:hypothetical protein